jgi:hypothetical protein
MSLPFSRAITKQALLETLPENDQSSPLITKNVGYTYVPPSHARALDPENTLVEGIRGAGKSFWFAALDSEEHLKYVASVFPEARIDSAVDIVQGFPGSLAPAISPLTRLAETYHPRSIWRAILGRCLGFGDPFPQDTWENRVGWVTNNPESYEDLFARKDNELASSGRTCLVLFDALDRLAEDWPRIRPLGRALFQIALDLRASQAIRAKLFVRPDMVEDREILAFPDASKLLARKVSLAWRRVDLYALLFQCLGNAPSSAGEAFRHHCLDKFGLLWVEDATSSVWKLPYSLRVDENTQRNVFHAITGPTMASGPSGHKRGLPYTWLANHLVDGRDQVSPRSFFAALRHAVSEDVPEHWEYTLHYRAIQAGVQEASRIRVDEIVLEDYPWVQVVMEPLERRIVVPCDQEDILAVWRENQTIECLRDRISAGQVVKLPPQHLDKGPAGIIEDLQGLGLFQRLRDGRVQMPDVYRIAFKFGRKGGVKPLR